MSLEPKQVDFNEVWQNLRETAKEVITLQAVKRAVWNNKSNDVQSLWVAYPDSADELYFQTKLFLENHVLNLLTTYVVPPNAGGSGTLDKEQKDTLLERYYNAWTEYSQGIGYINNLYLYLNQQHIKKQKNVRG